MNRILMKLQKEWERTLLMLVLLAVLLCLGIFAYHMMNGEKGSGSERNTFRTPYSFFDVTSRLYMDGPALD